MFSKCLSTWRFLHKHIYKDYLLSFARSYIKLEKNCAICATSEEEEKTVRMEITVTEILATDLVKSIALVEPKYIRLHFVVRPIKKKLLSFPTKTVSFPSMVFPIFSVSVGSKKWLDLLRCNKIWKDQKMNPHQPKLICYDPFRTNLISLGRLLIIFSVFPMKFCRLYSLIVHFYNYHNT